jgi:hypothetical protein
MSFIFTIQKIKVKYFRTTITFMAKLTFFLETDFRILVLFGSKIQEKPSCPFRAPHRMKMVEIYPYKVNVKKLPEVG